jgi:hypothetical protein
MFFDKEIESLARANLSQLPEDYKKLKDSALYPVVLSSKLQAIRNSKESHLRIGEGRAPD